ncbi:MAG TPA: four helix bundle protein [Pyrinomonadaceae bacterium]|nr:four helix bundle protein [Pyrinomonadaceae bacterium]
MNSRQDLRKRTKDYALRIIKLYAALPNSQVAQVLGKQLLRSGTSSALTIEKRVAPNRMLISLTKSKGHYKS